MAIAQTLDELYAAFEGREHELIDAIKEAEGPAVTGLDGPGLLYCLRVKYYGPGDAAVQRAQAEADYEEFCRSGRLGLCYARCLLPNHRGSA